MKTFTLEVTEHEANFLLKATVLMELGTRSSTEKSQEFYRTLYEKLNKAIDSSSVNNG
jgi:hypothetical protein